MAARRSPPFRLVFLSFLFLVFLSLVFLVPRLARAESDPCPQLAPTEPHASVVRVEALEHIALGVVVAAPDLVVVPFRAVEVDKVDGPDAYVIDAGGRSVPASMVATDARRRIALLRTPRPVGPALPLHPVDELAARACSFVVGDGWELGRKDVTRWSWVRFRALPASSPERSVTRLPATGSPLVDSDGRLVAVVAGWDELVAADVLAALVASPSGAGIPGTAGRRSVIGYGGIALSTFEMAGGGGAWWGGRGSVAGRYRDLLEGRLDLGLSFLLPRHDGGDDCGEPPCFAGARVTLTPSIGVHLRIAWVEHRLAGPVALKPSLGAAFVFQEVTDRGRAKAFDANAPGASWTLAPGLAVALHVGEIGVRFRLPRGEVRAPTWEMAVGFLF